MNKKLIALITAVTMIIPSASFLTPSLAENSDGVWMPNPINVRETLDRGLAAMQIEGGIYLSWRLQADEDNVYGTGNDNVSFDIYRDGQKIAVESYTTNYIDKDGDLTSEYQVVRSGTDKDGCEKVKPFSSGSNYFDIELDVPAPVSFPSDSSQTDENSDAEEDSTVTGGEESEEEISEDGTHAYTIGDSSCGDLDGDGEYEIVVKWDCSPKDNSHQGYTGNVILAAYKLSGEKLWSIDLGKNIRSGAHYTQFLVYDFDGDGMAEVTCKTAPGSKDANGEYVTKAAKTDKDIQAVTDDENEEVYVSNVGRILTGDEYFTIFDGKTGAALDTIYYPNQRLAPSIWGDSDTYGNRVDRFTAAVAYLDGKIPYAVYMRGYYYGQGNKQRQAACAISYDGEKLDCKYSFDTYDVNQYTDPSGYTTSSFRSKPYSARTYKGVIGYEAKYKEYFAQGNHNCTVADIDNDGRDEVLTGAMCYHIDENDNLRPLWTTFKGHGDALHIGDYDPTHNGYEFFVVHEEGGGGYDHGTLLDYGMSVIDPGVDAESAVNTAPDNIIMYHHPAGGDTGRGMMANIGSGGYYQFWGAGTQMSAGGTDFRNSVVPGASTNFRIFWDGDLYEELLSGTSIASWDENKLNMETIFRADGCISVNGTKAVPALSADLFGDWREEVVYPLEDNTAIRVYTTDIYTEHKMKSLMYDNVYRLGVAAEQTGYNQPPHIGYFLDPGDNGEGKTDAAPEITIPDDAATILYQNANNSEINSYYKTLPEDINGISVGIGGNDSQKHATKYFAVMNQGLSNKVFKMQNGDYANVNRGVTIDFTDGIKTAVQTALDEGKYSNLTFAVKLFDGTDGTECALHFLSDTAGNETSTRAATDYKNKIASLTTSTLSEGEWGIVRYEFDGSGYKLYLNDEKVSSGTTEAALPILGMTFNNKSNNGGSYTSMIIDDIYVYATDPSTLPTPDPLLSKTEIKLTADADTYLVDSTTAHGTEEELKVNQASQVYTTSLPGLKDIKGLGLIRFDASEYKNLELEKAVLHLYDRFSSTTTSTLYIDYCTKDNWDESTATTQDFNIRASQTDFKTFDLTKSPSYNTNYFEVTADVTDILNADSDNIYTFALYTGTAREQVIASKEYTGSDAEGPYLELIYKPAVPESISASIEKTEYLIGEELDTSGLSVTADYGNGETRSLESGYEISGFDSETEGTKTVTVSYRGITTTFTAKVKPTSLIGISVASKPIKTRYLIGEALDTAGLVIRADYNNGTYDNNISDYTISDYDKTELGEKTVTVTYEGFTAGFTVEYVDSLEPTPAPTSAPATPKPQETLAPEPTDEPEGEKTAVYSLNVTSLASKDVTVTVSDKANSANADVPDFGTATDYTDAVPALDGWGYMHFAYDGTSGRQSSAHVRPSENTFYVQGVGNGGCNGAISFIPKNRDDLTLSADGVEVYEFDAVVTSTATSTEANRNGGSGSLPVGFTSSDNGAGVSSVYSTSLAATGKNGVENTYKMTFVNDKANGKYYVYQNGILKDSGSSTAITGVYAQTIAKYIKIGFRNLIFSEQTKRPVAPRVVFKGDGGEVLLSYSSVLAGTELTAPEAPVVSGKTFKEWQNSSGDAVTTFTAGYHDTVYTAVYDEGSTISTVNAYVDRFAKITLESDENKYEKYSDVYGMASFEQIPQGDYTYTISKTGYTEKTGELTLGNNDYELEETLEYDNDHSNYLYYEADWTDGAGSITDGTQGGFSTDLGSVNIKLPKSNKITKVFDVSVTADASGFDSADSAATWLLKSNEGVLLGLHWSKGNGIYAFTGWDGSAEPKGTSDTLDKAQNTLKLAEDTEITNKLTVSFSVDSAEETIVVSLGEETAGSLPMVNGVSTLNSMSAGATTSSCDVRIYELGVTEPEETYMALAGDTAAAKISGTTVTRQYSRSEASVSEGEEFTWSLEAPSDADESAVTIDQNGLLSVADTANPGTYTIKCKSKTNVHKSAVLNVEIKDFQEFTLKSSGPATCDMRSTNEIKYVLTSAVDTLDTEVVTLIPKPVWTSSNTDVAEINASTGILTLKSPGSTTITATVTNGTAVSHIDIPVTVVYYYITADADGNSTEINIASLPTENVTGYQITTASADGALIKKTTVSKENVENNTITADTTGADKVEIAPVFSVSSGIKPADERYTFNIPADTYDFSITMRGYRADVYVNNQMLINNMLQNSSSTAVVTGEVHDIVLSEDYAVIKTSDYSTGRNASSSTISNITIVKSPSVVTRKTKMYVLGDSLVATYYNGGSAESDDSRLIRSGWGQVLQNYISDDIEVVNLANSGSTASVLYNTAFSQVKESAKAGDYLVIESGYNDQTYDTEAIMKDALTAMYTQASEKQVNVIFVSPNASSHDYKANVSWTKYMEDVAEELNADYIDLAQLSYDFLSDTYGSSYKEDAYKYYNVDDLLHSTYNGAQKWASVVAQGLYDLGYTDVVNTDYLYTFSDGTSNEVTAQVIAESEEPTPTAEPTAEPTATPEPTAAPTAEPEPTPTATPEPTAAPTEEPEPTPTATPEPTAAPTAEPEPTPTATPTPEPTAEPTATPEPTAAPTEEPEPTPTATPTSEPTVAPTAEPTATPEPTAAPTEAPTAAPTEAPTEAPTAAPTVAPTEAPTEAPTAAPTEAPTAAPTEAPTAAPTAAPTEAPTAAPTEAPTAAPTVAPTEAPTEAPTAAPTTAPTAEPEPTPTATPEPTAAPTAEPEPTPTATATPEPTTAPTAEPEPTPTATPEPTTAPTAEPEPIPTATPTSAPTASPTDVKITVSAGNTAYVSNIDDLPNSKGILIAAAYDGGVLKKVCIYNIGEGNTSANLNSDFELNDEVVLMVWDSLTSMIPYAREETTILHRASAGD